MASKYKCNIAISSNSIIDNYINFETFIKELLDIRGNKKREKEEGKEKDTFYYFV